MSEHILEDAVFGDQSALEFLHLVSEIAHTWDDLVDGDKAVHPDAINVMLWKALILLPANEFYRKNEDSLRPVLATSIINWRIANKLEHEDERLEIAYIIRSSYIDLAIMCAMLIGGADHAASVGVGLRMWNHAESPQEYLASLRVERQGAKP